MHLYVSYEKKKRVKETPQDVWIKHLGELGKTGEVEVG